MSSELPNCCLDWRFAAIYQQRLIVLLTSEIHTYPRATK